MISSKNVRYHLLLRCSVVELFRPHKKPTMVYIYMFSSKNIRSHLLWSPYLVGGVGWHKPSKVMYREEKRLIHPREGSHHPPRSPWNGTTIGPYVTLLGSSYKPNSSEMPFLFRNMIFCIPVSRVWGLSVHRRVVLFLLLEIGAWMSRGFRVRQGERSFSENTITGDHS